MIKHKRKEHLAYGPCEVCNPAPTKKEKKFNQTCGKKGHPCQECCSLNLVDVIRDSLPMNNPAPDKERGCEQCNLPTVLCNIASLAGEGYARMNGTPKKAIKKSEEYRKIIKKELKKQKQEIIKVLRKAEINCSGNCGAGCEIAVQNCINKLKLVK